MSFGALVLEDDVIDEYDNDDDCGFITIDCKSDELSTTGKEIAEKHGFPERGMAKSKPPALNIPPRYSNNLHPRPPHQLSQNP